MTSDSRTMFSTKVRVGSFSGSVCAYCVSVIGVVIETLIAMV